MRHISLQNGNKFYSTSFHNNHIDTLELCDQPTSQYPNLWGLIFHYIKVVQCYANHYWETDYNTFAFLGWNWRFKGSIYNIQMDHLMDHSIIRFYVYLF